MSNIGIREFFKIKLLESQREKQNIQSYSNKEFGKRENLKNNNFPNTTEFSPIKNSQNFEKNYSKRNNVYNEEEKRGEFFDQEYPEKIMRIEKGENKSTLEDFSNHKLNNNFPEKNQETFSNDNEVIKRAKNIQNLPNNDFIKKYKIKNEEENKKDFFLVEKKNKNGFKNTDNADIHNNVDLFTKSKIQSSQNTKLQNELITPNSKEIIHNQINTNGKIN